MKIIAFNASPRKNGNTATLLAAVLEGASLSGAHTELIHLIDHTVSGCRGCGHCNKHPGECALKDDFNSWIPRIMESDAIVVGTPIYVFQETSLCKSLIERFYCFIRILQNFRTGEIKVFNFFPKGKKICYIISQGFPNANAYSHIVDYLCMIGSSISGDDCEVLLQSGAQNHNAAKKDSDILQRARKLGEQITSQKKLSG